VAVIAAGRIVAEGPPSSLAGRDRVAARVRFRAPEAPQPPLPGGLAAELGAGQLADGRLELVPDSVTAALARLTAWAVGAGVELEGLEILRPSLEDVYLELTGPAGGAGPAPDPAGAGAGRRSSRGRGSPGGGRGMRQGHGRRGGRQGLAGDGGAGGGAG
jgi:ABC-2 type transport system ATP-binding protein